MCQSAHHRKKNLERVGADLPEENGHCRVVLLNLKHTVDDAENGRLRVAVELSRHESSLPSTVEDDKQMRDAKRVLPEAAPRFSKDRTTRRAGSLQ